MPKLTSPKHAAEVVRRLSNGANHPRFVGFGIGLWVLGALAVAPALAQSPGAAFCDTAMAGTIRNVFDLITFGGPLLGGVLALGATVVLPIARTPDQKREFKEIRNQGIIYGLLVAPLGTTIVRFILNTIVVGGASCTF